MRANAWEEIGKELKIKRDASSRDVRIVCRRLKRLHLPSIIQICIIEINLNKKWKWDCQNKLAVSLFQSLSQFEPREGRVK
jgi:hypothetical protein